MIWLLPVPVWGTEMGEFVADHQVWEGSLRGSRLWLWISQAVGNAHGAGFSRCGWL
jgi:hypothetical protein